jgi:hypothetical protein
MASKTGKLLQFINYVSGVSSLPRLKRTITCPASLTLAPAAPLQRMRVTVLDGRQIVGR